MDTNPKINERRHLAASDAPGATASEQDILRDSEGRYRYLFNAMDQGYCIIEMIFDDQGKAVDWTFLETNPAFHQHTGMGDVIGKRIRQLIPDHDEHWFETYGQVALTGQPARFINHARQMNRWFDLNAFRVGGENSRKVAILFNNITKRQKTEQDLVKALIYADDIIATPRQTGRLRRPDELHRRVAHHGRQSRAMTDLSLPTSTPSEELIHDMRNCLFAIQSVARALPMIRSDDKQFKMAHEALSHQVEDLRKLLAKAEPLIKRPT